MRVTRSLHQTLCLLAALSLFVLVVFLTGTLCYDRDMLTVTWHITAGLARPTAPPPVSLTRQYLQHDGVDVVPNGLVEASLGRPLCVVLVMGSSIDLARTAESLQTLYPNCLFHIYSPILLVPNNTWPPPPPYAFYHHSYYLVGDDYDAVGPLVDARPVLFNLVDSTDNPYLETHRGSKVFRRHEPLKASTVFSHFEPNRVAAVIAQLETAEDEQALKDALRHTPAGRGRHPGFLDLVVVQRRSSGAPITWLHDEEYGSYVQWADRDGNVFYVRPDVGQEQSVYPRAPTMVAYASQNEGRFTNQVIQDLRAIAYFGELCGGRTDKDRPPICDRVFVPVEDNSQLHDGALMTLYNFTQMPESGFLANRFISPAEFVTIGSLAWCNQTMRELWTLSVWDGTRADCEHHVATGIRHPVGNESAGFHVYLNGGDTSRNFPGDQYGWVNDTTININSQRLFFQSNWVGEGAATNHTDFVKDMSWLSYSGIIDDLAQRQHAIYEARARKYWKLVPTAPVRFVAMHVRLGDYDYESKKDPAAWARNLTDLVASITQTMAVTAPAEQPVHGIVLCTDDSGSDRFKELNALFPAIPKFDCAGDLVFDRNRKGFIVPVIQQMLALSTCFIGLRASSFAERIVAIHKAKHGHTDCTRMILGPRAS